MRIAAHPPYAGSHREEASERQHYIEPWYEITLLYSSLLQNCPFSQKKARGVTHGFMEVQVPPHETTRLVSQKHHFAVGGYG